MFQRKGFGLARSPLIKIKDQYAIWPVTVWDIDHTVKQMKKHKVAIGDEGEAREHGTMAAGYKTTLGASKNQVSIFNPYIMAALLKLYPPPPGGNIYDPFGGGGTRAIVTACQEEAFNYIGVELRAEEVAAINTRINRLTEKGYMYGTAGIIHGNSAVMQDIEDKWADMIITCPPYYNMEQYKGGQFDLSMAGTYEEFLGGLSLVIDECYRVLKPGGLACWVVGLHRDEKGLIPLHHDVARLHAEGFRMKEEIILHMKNTGSVQRVGNFAKGEHLLVRCHEYCLIFERMED